VRIHQYLYTVTGPTREEQARFLDNLDEQVGAANEAGFEGIWMPEHHAASKAFPPPFQLLSWFAGRHPGMTYGTHIALVPLYHPLHLAEAMATLDWQTGGKTIFGFGSGFRPAEFNAFGVDLDKRFEYSKQILKEVDKLLRGERATFEIGPWVGKEASVTLRPQQDPRPVMLWAATLAPGVNTALACADGLMPNMMAGMSGQLKLLDDFDARNGKPAPVRPVTAEIVIADTREKAEKRAIVRLGAEYGSFKHWKSLVPNVAEFADSSDHNVDLVRDQAIIGTAEDVYEAALVMRERGVTDFILRLQQAETSQAEVLDAIRAIGAQAISRLGRKEEVRQ